MIRIVLAVLGGLVGAGLAGPGDSVFDVLIGAVAGFALGDLAILRSQLNALVVQLKQLSRNTEPPHEVSAPSAASPTATSNALRPIPMPAAVAPSPSPAPYAPAARPSEAIRPAAAEPAFVGAIRSFLTGGNALVRIGVIVLFFGVAFLLRYMAEHTRIPIEFRLTGIALGGIALLVVGWHLRRSRGGYALALQGGGVGILYLTVFSALRLYAILPASIAFPILAGIAVFCALLAVRQDSMSFALLAVTGGFLAPILASTGQGSHVVLFSYFTLLNAGILAIAWFKAWRPLNIAGFIFTFAIGTIWGILRYRAEDFASTEPFLVLYFFFYLGISILFTLRQPAQLTGYIDGTLIFGTPIAVFALQSSMLHHRLMALAYSAVAMSAVYLVSAWWLKRRRHDLQTQLVEAFIALGIAFLTLAVPLALDARWNAAAWALEGTALIWVGCRQRRMLPRVSGALLHLAAGCIIATQFDSSGGRPYLPPEAYFGIWLQCAAALFSARTLNVYRNRLKEFELPLSHLLFWWALWWWLVGGLSEISHYLPANAVPAALTLLTATAVLCSEMHRRTQLSSAKIAALLQLPAMLVVAAHTAATAPHPFAGGGWLAWPAAFAGLYFIMHRHEGPAREPLANALNAVSAGLLCVLVSWEAAWAIDSSIAGGRSWPDAAWAVFPAMSLLALPQLTRAVAWPFSKNRDAYIFIMGPAVALYLALWSVFTNATSLGDTAPLPYLPLFNPLDLVQVLALLTLFKYWRVTQAIPAGNFSRIDSRVPAPTLGALAFVWLNAVLLRTLHQWFGVAFGFDELMRSTLVQMSLSIFWTTLALATMLVAARRHWRGGWLAGAVLMGVVIAKLFLVDLSRVGSIERIVSFVGVGLLMLIVGYFSPLPPAAEKASR